MERLVAYFRGKGMGTDEAADLAQETVLRTLVHLRRHGQSTEDLRPLTKTIARNLLVQRLRKPTAAIVSLADASEIEADDATPDDHVVAAEQRHAVRAALRSLSPRHRRVVELWLEGRDPVEIGRELGIKRNAVDAVLHRARRALASRLAPRALWGLVALAFIRFRLAAREAAQAAASWSPASAAVAPAAVSLATVGLCAVVTVVGSAPVARSRVDFAKTPIVAEATTPRATMSSAAHDGGASRAVSSSRMPPAPTSRYVWSAGSDIQHPTSGSSEDVGVDVSYEPDKNGRGPVDSLLIPVFNTTCGSAPPCLGGEK
jgi:RNA polymerase sigma-70 factor (ECF subfamily)